MTAKLKLYKAKLIKLTKAKKGKRLIACGADKIRFSSSKIESENVAVHRNLCIHLYCIYNCMGMGVYIYIGMFFSVCLIFLLPGPHCTRLLLLVIFFFCY